MGDLGLALFVLMCQIKYNKINTTKYKNKNKRMKILWISTDWNFVNKFGSGIQKIY